MRMMIMYCAGQVEHLKQFRSWKENEHILGRISAFEDVLKMLGEVKDEG